MHAVWERQTALAQMSRQSLQLASDIGARKVVADKDLLERLIDNLLEYVRSGAAEGQLLHFEARVAEDGGTVMLRAFDDGPGVSAEGRDNLFDRYAPPAPEDPQLTRSSRHLALVFCRHIAEAHGGRIFIEDRTPSGTAFCVQLPLALGYLPTDGEVV